MVDKVLSFHKDLAEKSTRIEVMKGYFCLLKSVHHLVFHTNKKSVVDFTEKKEYDKSVLNSAVSRKLLT